MVRGHFGLQSSVLQAALTASVLTRCCRVRLMASACLGGGGASSSCRSQRRTSAGAALSITASCACHSMCYPHNQVGSQHIMPQQPCLEAAQPRRCGRNHTSHGRHCSGKQCTASRPQLLIAHHGSAGQGAGAKPSRTMSDTEPDTATRPSSPSVCMPGGAGRTMSPASVICSK